MKSAKPPQEYWLQDHPDFVVFLAGTIDMGDSVDWQAKLTEELKGEDIMILNPRRDDWDSSWEQSIRDENFVGQVDWELTGQEHADLVVFYFADGSKSPITMLELGLAVGQNKPAIVYCTDEFYRKGNVDVVCDRHGIPVAETWDEFVGFIREAVRP